MSADLLAAFGKNDELSTDAPQSKNISGVAPTSSSRNIEDTWQPWPTQSEQKQVRPQVERGDGDLWKENGGGNNVLFDADDFGDFENAEADDSPATIQHSDLLPNTDNRQEDLLNLNDDDLTVAETKPTSVDNGREPPGADLTVAGLEDIVSVGTLVDQNDDWGNFEGAEDAPIASTKSLSVERSPDPPVGRLATSARNKPVSTVQPPGKGTQGTAEISHTATIIEDDFDAWDDFEDGEASLQIPAASGVGVAEQGTTIRLAEISLSHHERPTNVPPPVVLLSLFTKIWPVLAAQARQSQDVKDVAVAAVTTYRISARIISGRALRWKRDTILAQSMRIGAAGRSGGMKLTALDKGESRKEDQEAEEAIASWTRVSHILNAAMVKAKVQKPPISLSTKLVVRTVTGPDVLNANRICSLCGLKRNERINGIDIDVSDVFGEFWVEHWGHRDCCVWWERYNQLLEQK